MAVEQLQRVRYESNERLDLNDHLESEELQRAIANEVRKHLIVGDGTDGRVFRGFTSPVTAGPNGGFTFDAVDSVAIDREGNILFARAADIGALSETLSSDAINYIHIYFDEDASDSAVRRVYSGGSEIDSTINTRYTQSVKIYRTTTAFGAGIPSFGDFSTTAVIGGTERQLMPIMAIPVNASDNITTVLGFQPSWGIAPVGPQNNWYHIANPDLPHDFSPTDIKTMGMTDMRSSLVAIADRIKQLKGTASWYEDAPVTMDELDGIWTVSGSDIYRDTGNVGVGETSPATKLHIKGGDNNTYGQLTVESTGSDARIELYNVDGSTSTGRAAILMSKHATYTGLRFMINNADAMIIDENRQIGIGTPSPGAKLHLSGVNGGRIRLTESGTNGQSWDLISANNATHGVTDGSLLIYNVSGGSRVNILPDGKVGIGTNPSRRLHVYGSGAEGGAGWFECADSYNTLMVKSNAGATFFQLSPSAGNAAYIDNQGNSYTYFRVNGGGTTAITIDTAGKVGLGVTPTNTLTVNGGITKTTASGTYEAGILGYTDTNWGFLHRPPRAGVAAAHGFEAFGGTQLMRIQEDGKVMIGVGAPEHNLSLFEDNNAGVTTFGIDNLDQRLVMGCWYESGVYQYAYIQAYNNAQSAGQSLALNHAGGNVGIGTVTPGNKLDVTGMIRATGTGASITGAGIEMEYSGGIGYIQAYNRGGSVYVPLVINGSSLSLNANSGGYIYVSEVICRGVDTGVLSLNGGNAQNAGANIELYGGTHATFANQAYYDAADHNFRRQDGASTYLTLSDSSITIRRILNVYNAAASVVNIYSSGSGQTSAIELGTGGTGSRYAYIDFVGDDTYSDYGLRIVRGNTGANTTTEFKHRGTGGFNFVAQEASTMNFYTDNQFRMALNSIGNLGVGTNPFERFHVHDEYDLPDTINSEQVIAWITGNAGDGNDHGLRISSRRLVARTTGSHVTTCGIRMAWAPGPQDADSNGGRAWYEMGNVLENNLAARVHIWGFDAQEGTAGTEAMRLTSAGLGVGANPTEAFEVFPDTDVTARIGRAEIGYDGAQADEACFGHTDVGANGWALRQYSNGVTRLNSGFLQNLQLAVGNTVAWVIGGSSGDLVVQGAYQIQADNSSSGAGAPAYTFVGNVNTGMFQVSDNIIGWSCAGTEVMRLTSNDLVLVGTDSIIRGDNTNRVLISGGNDAGVGAFIALYGGSHATLANDVFYNADVHTFRSQSTSVSYGTWDSNGLTLTGTSTANLKLVLNAPRDASLTLNADTDNLYEDDNCFIKLMQDAGGVASVIGHTGVTGYSPEYATVYTGAIQNALLMGTYNTELVQFGTNSVVAMTIDAAQEVGIGTNNPGTKLHVQTAAAGRQAQFMYPSLGDGEIADIAIGRSQAADGCGLFGFAYDTTSGDGYSYIINYGDNFPTCLCVRKGGNVGIGTITPEKPLVVQSTAGGYGQVRIKYDSAVTSSEASIAFYKNTAIGAADIWVAGTGGWSNTDDFVIGQNGARLLIEYNTGNVGIARTSPSYKLDVLATNATYVANFQGEGNSTSYRGIRIMTGQDTPSGTNYFVSLFDGNGDDAGGIYRVTTGTPAFYAPSDERIKEDIAPTKVSGLSVINGLKLFQFRKTRASLGASKSRFSESIPITPIGFVAQQAREAWPEMVNELDEHGTLTVADGLLMPVVTKAIQELSDKLSTALARIEELEAQAYSY